MPKKRPRVVSLDEVRITRRGDTAEFDYADQAMGSMSLVLGVDTAGMSDDELLERHNDTVRAMEAARRATTTSRSKCRSAAHSFATTGAVTSGSRAETSATQGR